MENWLPVLQIDGSVLLNGNNIVLQNINTGEIGYLERTLENCNTLGIPPNILTEEGNSEIQEEEVNCDDSTTETTEEIPNAKLEWGDETKLLLDLYHEYLSQIGPMKKFKNKKKMWCQISADILEKLSLLRTPTQCETRYKTIMKRKTTDDASNKTSGNTRVHIAYETEINKIKSIDDSLEPEVLVDISNKKVNMKQKVIVTSDTKEEKIKKKTKFDVLLSIHKDKEEKREKRHKEKLELLKKILEKKTSCTCQKKDS